MPPGAPSDIDPDRDAQEFLRWAGLVGIAIGYTVLYLIDRKLRREGP